MSRVLVTGASGFIAGHVIRQLLEAGYEVRGTVRDANKAERTRADLERAGADVARLDFAELDLMNESGWDAAMAGCDALCHTASPFIVAAPKDPQEIIRPAVEGAERALGAALKAGVERFVLTSSFVAIGFGGPVKATAYDESDWSDPDGPGMSPYNVSKTLAERKAWEVMATADKTEALTVINPVVVFGPVLNDDLSASAQIVRRLLAGEFPLAPRLHFPCVDVRDVAALHVRALDGDLGGRRILAGADTLSIREMGAAIAEAHPDYARKTPKRTAPDFAVRLMALFDKEVASIKDSLGVIRHVDGARAEAALGRKLRPAREATTAMADSMIRLGIA